MADPAPTATSGGSSQTGDTAGKSDSGGTTGQQVASAGGGGENTRSRPVQTKGHYPERVVTYFQMSTGDLRTLGAANGITTLFASIGTLLLTLYVDFSKDIQMSPEAPADAVQLLTTVSNLTYWGGIGSWGIALFAYCLGKLEMMRIKEEHGEPTIKSKILGFFKRVRK